MALSVQPQATQNLRSLHYVNRITSDVNKQLNAIFEPPTPQYDWTGYKK
jgi:hypothetical protein